MRPAPSRGARNLVLVLVGLAVTVLAVGGGHRVFVVPAMRWPLLAAGVVVLLLAGVDIARHLLAGRTGTERGPGTGTGPVPETEPEPGAGVVGPAAGADPAVACGCEDDGSAGTGPRAPVWLLAVPALLVLFVGPGALTPAGAGSGGIIGGAPAAGSAEVAPLPPGAAPELGMWDLARRASARDGGASLAGRDVTVVATVLRGGEDDRDAGAGADSDAGPGDSPVRLGRVVITCCAADAHVVAVRVDDPASLRTLREVSDGGWVRARVSVVPGTATRESRYVPEATVGAAEPIPAPTEVYEYPRR